MKQRNVLARLAAIWSNLKRPLWHAFLVLGVAAGWLATPTMCASPAAQARIERVEPPNWWVGLQSDLMLLVTGESLEHASVSVEYPGVRSLRARSQPGGHYLFLWLEVSDNANPGSVPLTIQIPGAAPIVYSFSLEKRRNPEGSFQGLDSDDVLYLIMLDRFADGDPANNRPPQSPNLYDRAKARAYHGGDLRGIRDHLDYLRDLGVTAIWLTPIVDNDNASEQDYHGYGAVNEYAVEEHFGTLADLQDLVVSAHREGLKIILDFVPNHIGPRHPWVVSPPELDWFHGTRSQHTTSTGDFQFLADPHAPPRYWRNVVEGWFAGILPDMNQENPDVAQYFIENALWWAEETGIDGYRLDTFPYVGRHFWSEFHLALRHAYPRFTTVGEVFNPNPDITSFFVGGRTQDDGIDSGVTTVFDFPFAAALYGVVLEGASPDKIVDVLARDRLYKHPELLVPFFGNHDIPRFASARGSSPEKLKLAFSILLTTRGIPQLYYGDEIGMTGGGDPDNRHDFPGGFAGDARNAFEESGRTPAEQDIFSHVQRLLRLRHEHIALRRGLLWHIFWNSSAYAFARIAKDERILVVFNSSGETKSVRLSFADTPLQGARNLLPLFGGQAASVRDNESEVTLAARELQVYIVR